MSAYEALDALKEVQDFFEDEKERLSNGMYLRMCNALQKVYSHVKDENNDDDDDDDGDHDAPGSDVSDAEFYPEEESDSESERERTEDDMDLNELTDLWEWQFDFGRWSAVLPLEGLIKTIVGDGEEVKRVCAAVRVLNRALVAFKVDDPADAERILQWKEELIEDRAIRVCAELLEKVDGRGFHNESNEEHWWLYTVLCCEIVQLFSSLGENDALFRTKMRRNGALKGVEEYAKGTGHCSNARAVLDTLRR
jgi:hypothetical protein